MRKTILLIVLSLLVTIVQSQPNPNDIDSLKRVLAKTNEETTKVELLRATGYVERNLPVLQQALALAKKIKYITGEANCYNTIGNYFYGNSNYPKALEYYLEGLKISEANNYLTGIGKTKGNIGSVYLTQGDYQSALNNFLESLTIAKNIKDIRGLAIRSYDAAKAYLYFGKPDSALFYANQSYQDAISSKDSNALTNSLFTLGEVHRSLGNGKLALEYYHMAIPYTPGYIFTLPDIYVSMAKLFQQTGQIDSFILYAEKGLQSAREHNNGDIIYEAAGLLSALYEKKDVNLSFYYYKLAVAGKDSMFNAEKVKQIENLSMNETLRQQERVAEKLKEDQKRKHNLQYAGMALGMITFIILFLLLSHSIIANQKLIRFLGVIALLIVFEFINLFIHPYLSHATNDSPLIMLLVMVCIAALLVPVHHRLEKWISHRLVEKNKKIRLAAAKKRIATLRN